MRLLSDYIMLNQLNKMKDNAYPVKSKQSMWLTSCGYGAGEWSYFGSDYKK